MSLIKVENLSFSYPGSADMVFEDVNFQIDTDWKLGFVGRNGRGKTTFLNLLLGKYEYSGKIISSVEFDYFPYPVSDKEKMTEEVLQEVCPQAEEWELMRELSLLEVDSGVLWRPFETLSNGEQTKVLLAALFLNEGHFLLIDEPTNHLDTQAREKVAAYLNKKKGFILVSHDRRFLDGCVDHILSLNRANIEVQRGNFSTWMENFERQQESEMAQNERLKKDINRLQQSARRTSDWSAAVEKTKTGKDPGAKIDRGYIGHKSAKMMKRSKTIEARRQQELDQKSQLLKNSERADDLKLYPLSYRSDLLVAYSDVSVRYDGRKVCGPVTFEIRRGERVVIDGKNGSGKSSLLKILTEGSIEHGGTVSVGSGLVISYVPQDTSNLRGTLSDYARSCRIDETLFLAMLRKLDFERTQFEKDMGDFSGGQKKKVLIARSLCEQAHLYVWDEPLNFIDIYSRMQIEQLIRKFSPTMLFVEHDRAFQDAVATKKIEI
ncbi:MAG: Lsa family ABC-F type ribosomal protection protein [Lachnospiraceae bacterium]|jgi:lincosamide and streptogramin A transport system ATP-binding/permease protein